MALNGGKNYLAKKIIGLFPPRCKNPNAPAADDPGWLHFCEPYAGGLAVLLANDPEGISEVVNDKNSWLTCFWQVMVNTHLFAEFVRAVQGMPFAEKLWDEACEHIRQTENPGSVADAAAFFVACRQSLAGRIDSFAPLSRTRTRRGMNEQASAWLNCIEGLPAVHERLKRVVILCGEALDVIRQQDGPRTLCYIDPPYLHSTRATTGEYEHEMAAEQHESLLRTLVGIKGRFLLSGYHSDLYAHWAKVGGWRCHEFAIPNNAAGGSVKRRMVECVWINYHEQAP